MMRFIMHGRGNVVYIYKLQNIISLTLLRSMTY